MSEGMSQKNHLQQQYPCGQNGCGNHGALCATCDASFTASTTTNCPDGNLRCSDKTPCELCRSIAQSVVETRKGAGGKVCDVKPLQPVHDSSNHELCSECGKTLGSNTVLCGICASVAESPLNPEQPNIAYDTMFGPMKDSFGPCTDKTTRTTLEAFQQSFDASKKNGFPFTGIDSFKRSASLVRGLLSSEVKLGIEGFNNSCYYVAVFWMLSQGNMHERINTKCRSGHILYKILWDLRACLFVGRDIVEAFRLSLQDYPLIKLSQTDFKLEMNDPSYLLGLLEDDEVGIVRKGPIVSDTGCSFHVHELNAIKHCSIQDALCASVSSHSHVPEDGSIISFQFSQQKSVRFEGQILGTEFEFPHDGFFLAGKLLRPRMFIIYKSHHFLVVLCVGDSFFLTNSISASQCGHFLPKTSEISKEKAMKIFRERAHTIVFECIGNAYPPPLAPSPHCAQSGWFPQPPQPVPYAQVAQPPPPPPQAACAQVSLVPEHKRSIITEYDIDVSAKKWICSIDPEYSGRVEKTHDPKYPTTIMEVYFYQNVPHTTLDALVKFINFIKSIQ